MQKDEKTLPVPGVTDTLKAGFELTTRHPWLLIVPLLIDLWLWLGTRLNVEPLLTPYLAGSLSELSAAEGFIEQLPELLTRLNWFSLLSVPLYGVPTLTSDMLPAVVPLSPGSIVLGDWAGFWQSTVVLLLSGLVLGAIYYAMLAHVVIEDQVDWRQFVVEMPGNALRVIWLALLSLLLLFLALLPTLLVALLSGLFNVALVPLVILGGSVMVMWTAIFISFSLQSLLLENVSGLRALRNSVRFVQRNLNLALPYLLVVIVIGRVSDSLMIAADDGSWLTLVSILGHAFIATSLTAALFIFYRDRAISSSAIA